TAACLCKLGRTAKVLGKVGDDVFGSFVIEDLTQLFREAKKRSLATFLDVFIPSGLSISSEQVAAMLAYTDVVLPNDNEAYALTGLREPRAQAGYLARMNPATRDKRYPRTIGLPRSCTST
ncbi:MAG: hypothetical protein WBV90_22115, partial [Terrimicrobiaceae bacterium]